MKINFSRHQQGHRKKPKQVVTVLASFCVLLMLCKVNFHVVRSAFQNSMSVYFVYFCWSALLKLLRSAVVRWWSFAAVVNLKRSSRGGRGWNQFAFRGLRNWGLEILQWLCPWAKEWCGLSVINKSRVLIFITFYLKLLTNGIKYM